MRNNLPKIATQLLTLLFVNLVLMVLLALFYLLYYQYTGQDPTTNGLLTASILLILAGTEYLVIRRILY